MGRGLTYEEFKKQYEKSFSKAETVFEFWKQINDFSDPKKSMSTVRVSDDGTKFNKLESKVGFQNARDIALLYSFVKVLDPESVVREGEIKLSDSATGVLQALGININKIFTGEILDEQKRNAILSVANDKLVATADNIGENLSKLDSMVNDFKLNRKSIIGKGQQNIIDTAEKLRKELGKARAGDKEIKGKQKKKKDPDFKFVFEGIEWNITPDIEE